MLEDPWNTWIMLKSSPSIQIAMAIYLLAVFGYNLFAVLVTFLLSSIWHSILDNFRPMTVWITDLVIYYLLTSGKFGEAWNTYSWIQLGGMVVLIIGTMIYNAPDSGSILVQGQWYCCCGMDFTEEYNEIRAQRLFGMGSYPSLQRFYMSSARSLRSKDETKNQQHQVIHSPKGESVVPRADYGSLGTQQSI